MRGTVFHERRSGESATVFLDDGHVLLRVSCRAAAGELTENIPYALAVSFEVGVEANIQVYEEIRTRLVTPIHAAVNADWTFLVFNQDSSTNNLNGKRRAALGTSGVRQRT
jgi:hypothetical protein